eukprot:NODE_254_length_12812_cov_0.286872.p6 type:complete len:378 gc:universal NODE_254_length_12812_cov_0.286872:10018-11151(+)
MQGNNSSFWKTQPVTDDPSEQGEVRPRRAPSKLPFELQNGLEWATLDITTDTDMNLVYNLLYNNYVSDVSENQAESFKFAYSIQLLRWALQPPGHVKNWWLGIKKDTKLVAFITAIPITVSVNNDSIKMAEVNFLCVHKSLRSKQIAPILIQEITRRVHLTDIWQALYTAGTKLPGITSSALYYHRSLNIDKLVKVGFASAANNMALYKEYLHIKSSPLKLRLMEKRDADECFELFNLHNKSKQVYPIFSLEEFKYWVKPVKGTVWPYVAEINGKIVDFISFYHVTTIAVQLNIKVKIAYLWFHSNVNTKWTDLLGSALMIAQKDGFDCFNCLEGVGGSCKDLEQLKFKKGDGTLYYYFYNWNTPRVKNDKMGMFLL